MLLSQIGWEEEVTLLFHVLYGLQAVELGRGLIALNHYPTAESSLAPYQLWNYFTQQFFYIYILVVFKASITILLLILSDRDLTPN